MRRGTFDWLYLVRAEDSTTQAGSRFIGAFKTFLWLGVSILMGIGMAQLT
ncbi:hypothetical protein OAN24_00380 [Pseudodesulfovibrio sp.]|nr:hypothetical protein [Pseudodesulfovibrio sp.]